jgi:hypothetical protein
VVGHGHQLRLNARTKWYAAVRPRLPKWHRARQ